MRRRRSARHSPGTGRRDSGDRDHQADSGARRFARRTIAAGRCPRHEVPRTEAAQESRLPRLWHPPDDHQADRLRRVLRNPRRGSAGGGLPAISVEDLKKKLDAKADIFILDVREPHEHQICNLNGYLIPLGDLPKRVSELDSSREIVAHCKMGGRSAKAVAFLKQAGFTKVSNLTGGITAWAERIDPKMPKY